MMKKHRRFLVALIKTLTATNQSNPMNLNSLTMNVHVSKFSFHSKFLLLGQRCPASQKLNIHTKTLLFLIEKQKVYNYNNHLKVSWS